MRSQKKKDHRAGNRRKVFFGQAIFLFDESKNSAVLEPWTGHFRGLVGVEAKAKDFKMCPRGQGLHLCSSQ